MYNVQVGRGDADVLNTVAVAEAVAVASLRSLRGDPQVKLRMISTVYGPAIVRNLTRAAQELEAREPASVRTLASLRKSGQYWTTR